MPYVVVTLWGQLNILAVLLGCFGSWGFDWQSSGVFGVLGLQEMVLAKVTAIDELLAVNVQCQPRQPSGL
jgi:hypothetical protein